MLERSPDLVWQPDDVRRVAEEEDLAPIVLDGATQLDPFPQAQPHAFEAQRPAIAARGLAEAVRHFDAAGLEVTELGLRRPTLDEVFLQLTGHAAEEAQDEVMTENAA